MYRELSLFGKDMTQEDILEGVFCVAENNLSGICLYERHISKAADMLPDGITLSSFIDYPGGQSSTKLKIHAAIASIRKGANAINVVANTGLSCNGDYSAFYKEIKCLSDLCRDKEASLRVMLEYRYHNSRRILELFECLKDACVDYVYLSTGMFPDDLTDHIAISQYMSKKTGLNVIFNASIWNHEQQKRLVEAGIFGVSYHSVKNFKHSHGVL